jgi:hypothetical protein
MDKVIPDLLIDDVTTEYGPFLDIDTKRVPDISNEMAAVLAVGHFNLRTSVAALSRLLGWLAHQAEQHGTKPEDFMEAVTQQTLNYCRAFSSQRK